MARQHDALPMKPRLHRSYYVIEIPDSDNVLLYKEGRGVRLKPIGGMDLLPQLLAVVDGSRTVTDIVSGLGQFDSKLVRGALASLHEHGLLEEGDAPSPETGEPADQLVHGLVTNLAPKQASGVLDDLAKANVVVIGTGEVASSIVQMLDECGVGQTNALPATVIDRPAHHGTVGLGSEMAPTATSTKRARLPETSNSMIAEAALVIVASDHPDPDLVEAVNDACLEQAVIFLPVVLVGLEGRLGPTCIPGHTACAQCADLRVKSNLSRYEEYLLYEREMRRCPGARPFGRLPHFPAVLAGMAATEVFKLVTKVYPPTTFGRVVVMDMLRSESLSHTVLRVPRCGACGRLARTARQRPSYPTFPWFTNAADAAE